MCMTAYMLARFNARGRKTAKKKKMDPHKQRRTCVHAFMHGIGKRDEEGAYDEKRIAVASLREARPEVAHQRDT